MYYIVVNNNTYKCNDYKTLLQGLRHFENIGYIISFVNDNIYNLK